MNNNIFPLNWIYEKSISEYIEYDITSEMLKEQLPIYKEIIIVEEAIEALIYKIDNYENLERK